MPVSTVFIDSRSRNDEDSAFNYKLTFSDIGLPPFKNVTKIELKAISFPKVQNEDYVLLKINDLNTSFWTSDGATQQTDIFSVIYFDNSLMVDGVKKPAKGSDFYQKIVQLDGIYLSFFHIQYSLYNGQEVTVDKTNNIVENSLVLEITHG